MASIEKLSEEILEKIFEHFTIREKVLLESVCKRWQRILQRIAQNVVKIDIACHEKIDSYKCKDSKHQYQAKDAIAISDTQTAAKVIRRFPNLKAIYINVDTLSKIEPLLSAIGEVCTQIEHFEISFVFGKFTGQRMDLLLPAFNEKMKHFIFCESRMKCEMYPPGSVQPPSPFGNESIKSLFQRCPNLEMLVLNGSTCVSGDGLKYLPSSIKTLLLPSIWLNENDIYNVLEGNAKQIEEIELIAAGEYQFREICEKMTKLKSLQIPTLQIDASDTVLLLTNLKHLENLSIGLSGLNIDDQLIKIMRSCQKLKRLNLSSCAISDKSLSIAHELCPNLEIIEIYNYQENNGITDVSIAALSNLKNLRELCIPQAKITGKSVCDLLSKCEKLNVLNVEGCGNAEAIVKAIIERAKSNSSQNFNLSLNYDYPVEKMRKPSNLSINGQ
ncbi:F-box/LRR-repeat protein 7-like protein [Dinothrombium tinctorium]|uniref:F-box/LRR-repeat protein 7-like protein n=1 Tax=Dinothrombium tinctorium TaxID=1965070 RepID=A0A3S3PE46_9ACAR|nr:F-box/LRR-repeat protein 7-like protein [Dinothrombium tinctorium]